MMKILVSLGLFIVPRVSDESYVIGSMTIGGKSVITPFKLEM